MDSQQVEILGRGALIAALTRAGIEVATPIRDRGVDLIAYSDLKDSDTKFGAKLIQIKAASRASFSIEKRYAKFQGLILVNVWHVAAAHAPTIYAMPYPVAVEIGEKMGWTKTASWDKENGRYSNNSPPRRLVDLLSPHAMRDEKWAPLLTRQW